MQEASQGPAAMQRLLSTLFVGAAALLAPWTASAAADVLRIGGTGGATALLMHLSKPFAQTTGIAIEVIPSLGSGGAIKAVAAGALDVAITGRTLSAAELGSGLAEVASIRTPFVYATSHHGPVSMSEGEIVGAFAVSAATWPDGAPIKLILRPRVEDDNGIAASLFPGMQAAADLARQRAELPVATTDQDNADLAESLNGSLIAATYTQITMEHRDLRLIAIEGVSPGIDAFESGRYRYTKVFRIIRSQQPSAVAEQFTRFLASDGGARALREAGCLPGSE